MKPNRLSRDGFCCMSKQWDRRQVLEKRKVFKEDLKELTEVERRTETGSRVQVAGAW